ncbi:MAG TPA: hypothetical protein VF429_08285 [Anaerolineae bacterium]
MIDQLKHRTEFLFAHWAVPVLADLRGARWRQLIDRIATLPSTHTDSLALALVMIRVNGCANCDARRYRERAGCANCSRLVLTTLNHETEADLLIRYRAAQKEIAQSIQMQTVNDQGHLGARAA